MLLTFIRHCESMHNTSHMQHEQDKGLTSRGKNQAQLLKKLLALDVFTQVISSPLPRAMQTTQIIQPNDVPIISDHRLQEVRKPSALINLNENDDNFKIIKAALLTHGHKKDWHHSDEESYYQFHERLQDFLTTVKTDHALVITHSGVMRMIIAIAQNTNADTQTVIRSFLNSRHRTSIDNGTVLKLEKDAGKFRIITMKKLF